MIDVVMGDKDVPQVGGPPAYRGDGAQDRVLLLGQAGVHQRQPFVARDEERVHVAHPDGMDAGHDLLNGHRYSQGGRSRLARSQNRPTSGVSGEKSCVTTLSGRTTIVTSALCSTAPRAILR